MISLKIADYQEQKDSWPSSGRHILAQFDDESIIVYQAYKPSIGKFAAANNYFGKGFKYSRMSWIKPNFLWMMYRSGWGTKSDQEITLAIRLKRSYFDWILSQAVPSSLDSRLYQTYEEWQSDVSKSDVRLQWDPDHTPSGDREERRAVQLGLRGKALEGFRGSEIIEIEDISHFVTDQRKHLKNAHFSGLVTPVEKPYPVPNSALYNRLGIALD